MKLSKALATYMQLSKVLNTFLQLAKDFTTSMQLSKVPSTSMLGIVTKVLGAYCSREDVMAISTFSLKNSILYENFEFS